MEWHEAAMIFPMLEDRQAAELADDIKKHGQREPIIICSGKVIDGRNRWIACKVNGIAPITKEIDEPDDPVSFVLSLNLHRRHLTPSQASMCAARAREIYERQAKERQKRKQSDSVQANFPEQKGQSRDLTGKAFGVSGKSVDHAKRVIEKGIPELARAVDEGRMAVSTAAILATEPEEVQRAEIENPKRNRTYAKSSSCGKPEDQRTEHPVPKHLGEHNLSEVFAINKAEVAITQLKGIPAGNDYRDAALDRVTKWISSQRKSK